MTSTATATATASGADQRLVLGAIAKKILSTDPATMANTISALSQYITTDFEVGDIAALATSMQGIDPSKDIYSAMEPTISEYKNDTWYEQLDVAAWNTMMGEGLPPTEPRRGGRVERHRAR